MRPHLLLVVLPALLLAATVLHAQQKGTPGQFDFYLLNVVPAAEFCDIKDVGQPCLTPQRNWVLHGLWPQHFDGTYPVFCADLPGPRRPKRYLDLTPNLSLLDHEWSKHGTCTTLSPEAFFAAERRAFGRFTIPAQFAGLKTPITMKPSDLLARFAEANPAAPRESIILWCKEGRVTSVSQCLSTDLQPIACQGLKSCDAEAVTLHPGRLILRR